MHYDAVIIGAGMSGLAAGIRLAYFDKKVLIVERHYAYGGLNSYYTLEGREFDVGLHAVTNYAVGRRTAPMAKLFRQLRLSPDEFDLQPQRFSEVRFPGHALRFSNAIEDLTESVSRLFPAEADAFCRLVEIIEAYDDVRLDAPYRSARSELAGHLGSPLLIDMLFCPVMYYGSAEEHDMDFTQFVTMFKALFLEGMARPPGGVRTIIRALVRKYRGCGGQLRMRCGVKQLAVSGDRIRAVVLESGEEVTADVVLSSAGLHETMRLCGRPDPPDRDLGQVSFVESIVVLDRAPAALGHDPTIVFFNQADRFRYAVPEDLVDLDSGVLCVPNNYEGHESLPEGYFRITWLANPKRWAKLSEEDYRAAKEGLLAKVRERGEACCPGFSGHIRFVDMFTPRTIERFTGHLNGAVYGAPTKHRDGRTGLQNLFLCGTDQGFLGIIGAMLSGITMANVHVLDQA